MKKRIIISLVVAALAIILSVSAFAAGNKTVVYLKDDGAGDGSSASSPVGTLADAYGALDLSKDCTIVVCG